MEAIESIQNTPVKQQLQLEFTVAFTKENISRNRHSWKLKLGTFEMLFYLHSMQRINHQLQNFQFLQTGCVAKMRNTRWCRFFRYFIPLRFQFYVPRVGQISRAISWSITWIFILLLLWYILFLTSFGKDMFQLVHQNKLKMPSFWSYSPGVFWNLLPSACNHHRPLTTVLSR